MQADKEGGMKGRKEGGRKIMNGHKYTALTLHTFPHYFLFSLHFKPILVSQNSFIELQQLWPIHFILQKNLAKMYVS